MALTFDQLHPYFVAEVSPVALRDVHDRETLEQIRAGMDQYAVLVFHDQFLTDDEHIAFSEVTANQTWKNVQNGTKIAIAVVDREFVGNRHVVFR